MCYYELHCKWHHCWVHPITKKHYKLFRLHLDYLIDHVERCGQLESPNNIPYNFHKQHCNLSRL
ncbi:hypothetical protein BGZ63DRAFT_387608, partial [Mariannaea sp. PMI_226]